MPGLLERFRHGLDRTSRTLFGKLGSIIRSPKLSAASIEQFEEALFSADFGVETTVEIIDEVQAVYKRDKTVRGSDIAAIGIDVLRRILDGAEQTVSVGTHSPEVICIIGVNGSGKTTTTAKLAHRFQQAGHTVLIGACDTFRAAANEQIKTWAERLDVPLVSSHIGADAAAVAFDCYAAAKKRNREIVLLDTAGRLHTKSNLMEELSKLRRVLQKQDPGAPHHSWLVVDGSLGSNSIDQARAFHAAFGLTGLIVTKLDGTSRGGALVGIYRELKIPIYFVGFGEAVEDLQPFSIENYVRALFEDRGLENEED